jgi:DNA-binding NarL/FixJ family response regulator
MNASKGKGLSIAILVRLSLGELKVVQLILQGYDDQQIGRWLSITRNTVPSHNRNIRTKLGLPSRVPIARALIELLTGRSMGP